MGSDETGVGGGPDDPRIRKIREREFEHIRGEKSADIDAETLSGIAISGGGIRSGVYALGVLQTLAREKVLGKFDYMSSVSGGGYAACGVRWLLRNGADSSDFGLSEDGGSVRGYFEYLRTHGNYLIPEGETAALGAAVVIRAMFLNLIVWIPIAILIGTLFSLVGRLGVVSGDSQDILLAFLDGPFTAILGEHWKQYTNGLLFYFAAVVLAGFVIVAATSVAILYSLSTYASRGSSGGRRRYAFRRWLEKYSGIGLIVFFVLLLVGALPLAAAGLQFLTASALGVISVDLAGLEWVGSLIAILLGMAILVPIVHNTLNKLEIAGNMGIAAPLGCALFLYGFMIVAYYAGFATANVIQEIYTALDQGKDPALSNASFALFFLYIAWLVLAVVTGIFVNTNSISIHRFYRDRLMEAFMPNVDENGRIPDAEAPLLSKADDYLLSTVGTGENGRDTVRKLYPLVCCHTVLNDSKVPKIRRRGGESFLLSPLFCGSSSTAWVPTEKFNNNGMTLPTAMAISGAAVSPSAGVSGKGPTMNRFVGFTMALLNLNLGYWINTPRQGESQGSAKPNHFRPGCYALGRVTGLDWFGKYREDQSFVQISDGGHFDNSGLYELFRRKVRFILFLDGAADNRYKFDNFTIALRRAEQDFGVQFIGTSQGSRFVSVNQMVATEEVSYPFERTVSFGPFEVFKFRYAGDGEGADNTLVYLKLTMTEALPYLVKAYQAENGAFPHDSTANQFFDPDQVDAYRMIGKYLASAMFTSSNREQNLRDLLDAAEAKQ